ncbi:SRPBCC family protein [Phenylobacterium sp.]|uniref:SRPBCC family protein n=1 Tax=Phenylobacterium sp. TaxID=1871053 RepID=UPI002D0FC00C|nr:SRPBCC family protein [Phenylobacterium sp.]HVI33519.1 SRPBCC family protein [Phenylobacterium sp.]
MRRTLTVIAIMLVAAVAGLFAVAATRPDTFRVARSTTIQAPPEAIAAHVNDFHAWRAWSPYETVDPALKRSYAGPAAGVGAVYAYEGNDKVGAGRMEILETSSQRTVVALNFIKPMEARNVAEFTYEPQPGGTTRVTWAMNGPMPLMGKVMGLVFDMDAMVGKDFETGLANLKKVSET